MELFAQLVCIIPKHSINKKGSGFIMKRRIALFGIFALIAASCALHAVAFASPEKADDVTVCSQECPYLESSPLTSESNAHFFIPWENSRPVSSSTTKELESLYTILTTLSQACDSGHTHSFVFRASHGCSDGLCTRHNHTHYCSLECSDTAHCH